MADQHDARRDGNRFVRALFIDACKGPEGLGINGEPAERILEERLQTMPQPELVLMGAVLLEAPPSAWLDAVHDEEGGEVSS